MEPSSGKNCDIEILRAVAVCFVLYHHARDMLLPASIDFLERMPIGVAGVDLFFVISGFVIGKSFLPRLQSSASLQARWRETLAFWTRRAFRLLPTAWIWLALIVVAAAAFPFDNPHMALRTNLDATAAGVFYYANFRIADAFENDYMYGASFHYWTLSLEEQFYFLLPLAALLARKWLIYLILAAIAVDQAREPEGIAVVTRFVCPLLGVLLAIWSQQRSYEKVRSLAAKAGPVPLFICAMALVMLPFLEARPPQLLKFGFVALCGAVAVLIASFDLKTLTPARPFRQIGLWFGSRSYALYVIHVPLFIFIFDVAGRLAEHTIASFLIVPVAFAILFGLADLNFRYLETPLRNYGVHLSRRISGSGGKAPLEKTA